MRGSMRTVLGALLGLLGLAGGVAGQPTQQRLGEILLGNYMFILFHETGHALINELALPVVGVEEDVVDEFASVALIGMGQSQELPEAQQVAMHQLVVDAALGFARLWEVKTAQIGGDITKVPYWDEHGLDIKRFYNVMCIFVGSDPGRFAELGRQTGMPDERIARCERDFQRKDAAWERILTPHLRGDRPVTPEQRVTVGYGAATAPFSQALEADLKGRQLLESVAELLEQTFVLPRGLRISARECGEANAFYAPDEGSVTMCHELVAFLRDIFMRADAGQQPAPQPQPQPMPQPMPQPQPTPQPQPQPGPYPQPQPYPVPGPQQTMLDGYLIGNWFGAYADPMTGAPIQVQLTFMPGRAFSQLSQNAWTGFTMRVWGTFVIMGNALRTQVQGYEPTQYCGPTGQCSPITIPMAETVPIQIVDQNTMSAGPAWFQRVQ